MSFETILTQPRIDQHTRDGYWTGRTITDSGLREEVDRCALGLLELGVVPGEVVSFQLPNWIEWVVLHYAATRIGAISNPLIPIYREREITFMVALAKSRVIVVPGEFRGFDYPAMIDKLRPDLPGLEHVLVVDGQPGQGTGSWAEFMATPWEQRRDRAALAGLRPDPNEVTLLIFTSGTTGEPKGVKHKDVIIRGGENIPVVYVENVLYEHPRLRRVAIVGRPDPRLQERACACVVVSPGAEFTLEEMRRFLRDKGVARHYWPERLEVLTEFPATASDKIQKFRLREIVRDRAAGSPAQASGSPA